MRIHFFQTNADERDSQSTRTHTPTTAGRENCALLRAQRERISNTRFCDFYNIYNSALHFSLPPRYSI